MRTFLAYLRAAGRDHAGRRVYNEILGFVAARAERCKWPAAAFQSKGFAALLQEAAEAICGGL
jgi:hypothetical protein